MTEPGIESLKDTERLKETSLSFQICKKFGILHRIQCQFALDRLQSQLANNGNVITGYKNLKAVCVKCLFRQRKLTGD